ncbi:hypothetical protein ALI22I_33800 [Saccharothrix sp. ALI-22-I]|uniref:hypothetical protein n=1 Tax=Saccharothrix sp. ALI-22-I TaxID=1933778 RepID=UPI00097CB674|nr:hypothetical protein [Saccharothrix sp. ALI-22-I]ONI83475.1 hypothetical protein ALI22I_33800 [Saccharothrix sp. ALI-22-I]
MRKWLLWRIPALAFAASLAVASLVAIPERTLQEDDPGWKCHLMGNRDCGFVDSDNPHVVILVHFDENGEPTGVRKRVLPGRVSP